MSIVPESDLQLVLSKLIDATTRNATARKTAVRWFNRLYFDVRRWNEKFMAFLRTYPGFHKSNNSSEYKIFITNLEVYRDSLQERYGTVKNDLCTSLKILSARYPRDFKWLYDEDENLYHEIRRLTDDSYATEMSVISIAYSVCDFIYRINSDEHWHIQHHDEVVTRIREYENASKKAVADLQQMTESVGIHLLDIGEYEAILNNEGSINPNVMVVGEITMSQDNIHFENVVGPINFKSKLDNVSQIVNNAPAVPYDKKQEFASLIEELKQALSTAATVKPDDTQRVIQAAEIVAAEVAKARPNKPFLELTAQGLKEAAKAVEDIAPTVLSIAAKIAMFVAGQS